MSSLAIMIAIINYLFISFHGNSVDREERDTIVKPPLLFRSLQQQEHLHSVLDYLQCTKYTTLFTYFICRARVLKRRADYFLKSTNYIPFFIFIGKYLNILKSRMDFCMYPTDFTVQVRFWTLIFRLKSLHRISYNACEIKEWGCINSNTISYRLTI